MHPDERQAFFEQFTSAGITFPQVPVRVDAGEWIRLANRADELGAWVAEYSQMKDVTIARHPSEIHQQEARNYGKSVVPVYRTPSGGYLRGDRIFPMERATNAPPLLPHEHDVLDVYWWDRRHQAQIDSDFANAMDDWMIRQEELEEGVTEEGEQE